MAENELNAVVIQKIEVAPGLMVMRVKPDGWDLPDFIPGQFAVLGLKGSAPRCQMSDPEGNAPPDPDKLIKRPYSIASSSKAREYIEFYITLVRSGDLTPRLFALGVGGKVFLGPRFKGVFTLDSVPKGANIVMAATGTGLAPYMSMMRTSLSTLGGSRMAIIHGARHSWDLGYRSELITLTNVSPSFDYFPIISRPDEEYVKWGGHTGYVQDLWTGGVVEEKWGFKPSPENTHVFLCGNPGMVTTLTGILEKDGFREHTKKNPGQLHLEKWW